MKHQHIPASATAYGVISKRAVLFEAMLFIAAVASVVLLIIHRAEYLVVAELLLVFVIAIEGIVAINELGETRRQLRFDARLRLYDFSRELHSLAFDKPGLWKNIAVVCPNLNEEEEKDHRFQQLFCNLALLDWEASQYGFLNAWQRHSVLMDTRTTFRAQGMQKFWLTNRSFYPEDFRRFVDEAIKNAENSISLQIGAS